MRSRSGTWALGVFALAVVFGSTGMIGGLLYFGLQLGSDSDPSAWNLAWTFPLSGFLGLALVWVLLKLVSPPD